MKIGDRIRTLAGDRVNGAFGIGKVVGYGKWRKFPMLKIRLEFGGRATTCLVKNAIPIKLYNMLMSWRKNSMNRKKKFMKQIPKHIQDPLDKWRKKLNG